MVTLVCIYCAVAGSLALLWQVVGASIYDYRVARESRRRQLHPHARPYRERPLVSVIVLVSQQATGVSETLMSLQRNGYRKIELIIMSYGLNQRQAAVQRQQFAMTDSTVQYHFSHTKRQEDATHRAITRYSRGAYIFTLEAGQLVQQQTIRRAVQELQAHPEVSVLKPHIRMYTAFKFTNLAEMYIRLLHRRFQKADTVMGVLHTSPSMTYVFRGKSRQKLQDSHLRYANSVVVTTPITTSLKQFYAQQYHAQQMRFRQIRILWHSRSIRRDWLAWTRQFLALTNGLTMLCLPALVVYCAYVAVAAAQPTMLFVLLGLVSLLIVFAIVDEPDLQILHKIRLALGIPLVYSIFMVLGFLQYFIVLGTVVHAASNMIWHRNKSSSILLSMR